MNRRIVRQRPVSQGRGKVQYFEVRAYARTVRGGLNGVAHFTDGGGAPPSLFYRGCCRQTPSVEWGGGGHPQLRPPFRGLLPFSASHWLALYLGIPLTCFIRGTVIIHFSRGT